MKGGEQEMMLPKPVRQQKEKKPYNSLQRKKEKKPVAPWRENILAHHLSKSESRLIEGDEMVTQAFKECNECGHASLMPVRTANCPECGSKGSLTNNPEGLKKLKERLCECGCGEKLYFPKRFVSGHNGRLNSKPGTYRRDGRTYTVIKCSQCGNKFERRADQINRHGLKNYCSKKCMGIAQGAERKGKQIQALRKGENRNCQHCGKVFYAKLSDIKDGHGKFCSKKCVHQWQIDHPPKNFIGSADNSGEKNGRYKHGKRVGGHITKRRVREKVIERDGNWCLVCGKPGPGLHLHRVIYGSQCGKYQVDNCVLLCAEHHGMIHSNKKMWQPFLLGYIKIASVEPDRAKNYRVNVEDEQQIRLLTNQLDIIEI